VIAHREEHLDLCAARVLGGIGEADRIDLEQHLVEGCPVCERAMAEMSQGLEGLAASIPEITPSPRLREVVLARVRAEAAASPRAGGRSAGGVSEAAPSTEPGSARHAAGPGVPPRARGRVIELPGRARAPWPTWGLAAAAVVLAVSAVAAWRAADVLRGELGEARARIAGVERELADERAWAAVATRPGARVIELAPQPGGVALPRVRATYDPASRRAVVAFDALVTPAGSDFELWALRPDGPHSLGVVRADASGHGEVRVPDAGDPAALSGFAVSLEREGGSRDPRKPSGPVVLAGALKS
jgi:anti-sigma-K factor RskA